MEKTASLSHDQAKHLIELSRQIHWEFPSSSGTPIPLGINADELIRNRAAFSDAAAYLKAGGDKETALEVAANVWRIYLMSPRDISSGRAFLSGLLDDGETGFSRNRALALYGDSLLAFWQGATGQSRQRSEEAVKVADQIGNAEARLLARVGLSRASLDAAEYDQASHFAAEAREIARGLEPAFGQAPLHLCAQAARMMKEHDRAAALFEESVELNRRLDDKGMVAVELHNLGHVEARRGNIAAAERCFSECSADLAVDDPYDAALIALNQSTVAFLRGERDRALELWRRMELILRKSEISLAADDVYEAGWLRERLVAGQLL